MTAATRPRAAFALAALALAACAGGQGAADGAGEAAAPGDAEDGGARVTAIDLPRVTGLSGLTRDDRGALWTVAERDRTLVEISAAGAMRAIPIVGAADGQDLEAIAWVGGGRLAIGTEGACADGGHRVVFAEVTQEGGRTVARVSGSRTVSLAPWGAGCTPNRGIEGICRAGDRLVVAIEAVGEVGGRRAAPVAVIDLSGVSSEPPSGQGTALWVVLTSDTGKLSGLDCEPRGDAIEVVAIERHFEVSRLVAFSVPAGSASAPGPDAAEEGGAGSAPRVVTARVVADLLPHTRGGKRNFEGVARDGGGVALVVDNHYGGITGPSELVRVPVGLPYSGARPARPAGGEPEASGRRAKRQ